MTSPYDPYGKIYTILSEEWTTFLWSFEPVFIPPMFREHLVLVLGWTTGRQGYVSIAMVSTAPPTTPGRVLTAGQIIPNIPHRANPDLYARIRSPRRRAAANEITVTLRKNKKFAALVELSYVRLDWVWEVPFAILLVVPSTGRQLMLRAVSMEKIARIYAQWGWHLTWGQSYPSRPERPQGVGYHQGQIELGRSEGIKQGGKHENPQPIRQSCPILNDSASSRTVARVRVAENEATIGPDSTGSCDLAYRTNHKESGCSQGEPSPCAGQEMVYAGDAHCAALAKLLQATRSPGTS